jgi:hypothetical protein
MNHQRNTTGLIAYQVKPKWKSGKTRTIRVPVAIANAVLDYAHQLDSAESAAAPGGGDNLSDRLTDILVRVEAKETGYKANGATRLIKDLKSLKENCL